MRNQYIIWSPQGTKPPTVTLSLRWRAENEAKRLSGLHPNQVFHVCKIKSSTVDGKSAYFGKWRPRKSVKTDDSPGPNWDIGICVRPHLTSNPWKPLTDVSFEGVP